MIPVTAPRARLGKECLTGELIDGDRIFLQENAVDVVVVRHQRIPRVA